MKRDVAAVVVTYNRRRLLMECISRLRAQTCARADILVIDNHSTDGTSEALAPLAKAGEIRYFDTGANLGGAGGFQFGMRAAAEAGYEYLWLMDDDCMPEPTALQALMDAAAQLKDFGFLSSKVLWKDGTLCRMNIQRRTLTRDVARMEDAPIPVAMASFVSFFVPLRVVQEAGLPIREFFIWSDDWEYSRRISLRRACWLVPDSVVIHASARNDCVNIAADTPDRLDRYRYIYRNDVYLFRREGLKGWAYLALRTVLHAARVLLRARSDRGRRLGMILRGTREGLHFHPQIEYIGTCGESGEML